MTQPANPSPLDPELARFLEQCRARIVGPESAVEAELAAANAEHGDPAAASGDSTADRLIRLCVFHALLEDRWTIWFLGGTAAGTNAYDLAQHVAIAIQRLHGAASRETSSTDRARIFDGSVAKWLPLAEQEATQLGDRTVRREHFILALLLEPGPTLRSVLDSHNVLYRNVSSRMRRILARRTVISDRGRPCVPNPGVGVPRRFGLNILFLLTVLYAFLFAGMTLLRWHPVVILAIATFITIVGVGQAVLFGGKEPRRASIWVGAVSLPAIGIIGTIGGAMFHGVRDHFAESVLGPVFLNLVYGIPLGGALGYFAGLLAAGAFCVIDECHKRRPKRVAPEGQSEKGEP